MNRGCEGNFTVANVPGGGSMPALTGTVPPVAGGVNTTCAPSGLGEKMAIPREMLFNDDSLMSVIAYSALFIIAAVGNLTVFITLFRNRHRKSRVNLFILHLSIADMIVTFVMLPIEIGWHVTVSWKAGDIGCRLLMFFRAFGFYLSSFILVTISLDRYFAIVHPLSMNDADRRGKMMLTIAWIFSTVASLPQSVIFHLERHPQIKWYTQCVTFNFFPSASHELAYNLFNAITLYVLPLVIIVIAYSLILCEMNRKNREHQEMSGQPEEKNLQQAFLRRSAIGKIQKAKIRTFKMTIVIVLVFVMCWTPYFVISAWWWFDRKSAQRIDPKIQRGLFLFAVSNSCMDPFIYGMFSIDFKREMRRCCCHLGWRLKRESSDVNLNQRSSSSGSSAKSLLPKRGRKLSCPDYMGRLTGTAAEECRNVTAHGDLRPSRLSENRTHSKRSAMNDFTHISINNLQADQTQADHRPATGNYSHLKRVTTT